MSFPNIFDTTMARMSYALDGLSQRQSLITDNIANADTPGYLTKDVAFEQSLSTAMQSQDFLPNTGNGVPNGLPTDITRNDLRVRNDGNNVDANQQMTEMASTTVTYEAATQLISNKFGLLAAAMAPIS